MKDLTKIKLKKSTFDKIKSLYLQNKQEIDEAYANCFQTNEEFNFFKGIIYVILFFAIVSCYKVTEEKTQVHLKVLSKEYVPEKTTWSYHYGLSFSGKFEWHYGPMTDPAQYIVKLSNGETVNDPAMYKLASEKDSILFYEVKVFHDSTYHHTEWELANPAEEPNW
jgi:hypothetical protein